MTMNPRLIQTSKLDDDNRAEKEMLSFLTGLPEYCTIYRELRVTSAYEERVRGMEKGRPDFVVVGKNVGLFSIEVKDWNLRRNQYIWRDQETVIKKSTDTNEQAEIGNPAAQAERYCHAFIGLLTGTKVFVTSVVAFPRISRSEFLNRIANPEILQNPQSKFLLDIDMVIFKDDIDQYLLEPEQLLIRIARKQSAFRPADDDQIQAVNERILPNSFRIGDVTRRQESRQTFHMITQQQERWIFNLDRNTNYLLDVAGSGKTNALVSRAIHAIDQALKKRQPAPSVLLTTYNPNLQKNIEGILAGKVTPKERTTRYKTLRIENVVFIMERIATTGYGLKRVNEYHSLNNPASADYREKLRSDVQAALEEMPDKYKVFDYVFIDEIQDFDDEQLYLIRKLCKTDNFFFVGDIGQKLYDRYHDLKRHGFVIDELELPKSYKMYRTPRYIGQLAHKFIMADTGIRVEFEKHGYRQDTQFESYCNNAAEILQTNDGPATVVERITDYLAAGHTESDIMVITSEMKLPAFADVFSQAGIKYALGEPQHTDQVCVVDFLGAKGLEREIVIVTGIEDLYSRFATDAIFDDPATQIRDERFSRRKIYVALTRAIEECIVYYVNASNIFVSELLSINRKFITERQRML